MTNFADWYAKIVDDLYAGTLDQAAWDRAMLGICDMVRARGGLLLAFNPATGQVLRDEVHRFPPEQMLEYARTWASQDPRVEYARSTPVGHPVTELTLAIPKWKRTPILNEFLIPIDAPHAMPIWLHKSQTKAVALSLQGSRKRGPFQEQDFEAVRRLLPHLTRALEIRDRLEQAQIRANTWANGLDGITFGVFVLDSAGRCLEANAVARECLRTESGIRVKADGTLWLRQPAGGEIQRWILSGSPPARENRKLLHIARPHSFSLSVVLAPLPFGPTAWVGHEPRWLLLLFDPVRQFQAKPELIAQELSISPGEASLAALLVDGYTLQSAAHRLGVSPHTARTQLKSIFRKTGSFASRACADVGDGAVSACRPVPEYKGGTAVLNS